MDASNTEQQPVRTISPLRVTIIAVLIALVCPLAIQIYNDMGLMFSNYTIIAMTWTYQPNYWYGLVISPLMLLNTLPFTFMRLVFGYMLYRLYNGKSTQKRVLLTGITMELFLPIFFLIIYLPMLLMNPMWSYMPVLLPIPILLFYGVALVKGFPPPEEKLWIETEKNEYWWDKSKETEDPLQSVDPSLQTEEATPQTDNVAVQTEDDGWLKEN